MLGTEPGTPRPCSKWHGRFPLLLQLARTWGRVLAPQPSVPSLELSSSSAPLSPLLLFSPWLIPLLPVCPPHLGKGLGKVAWSPFTHPSSQGSPSPRPRPQPSAVHSRCGTWCQTILSLGSAWAAALTAHLPCCTCGGWFNKAPKRAPSTTGKAVPPPG